jgi:hypothetical protein
MAGRVGPVAGRKKKPLVATRDLTMVDRGIPGWKERIVEKVTAKQTERAKVQRRRDASLTIDFDLPFRAMLKQAAASRGIAVGSYARRAVAKQIAKDIGLDWRQVLTHCAAARPHGSQPPGAEPGTWGAKRTFDDGKGFGNWKN